MDHFEIICLAIIYSHLFRAWLCFSLQLFNQKFLSFFFLSFDTRKKLPTHQDWMRHFKNWIITNKYVKPLKIDKWPFFFPMKEKKTESLKLIFQSRYRLRNETLIDLKEKSKSLHRITHFGLLNSHSICSEEISDIAVSFTFQIIYYWMCYGEI